MSGKHTFLLCLSQESRRRVLESSSKSSSAASAANAFMPLLAIGVLLLFIMFAHLFICTVCCLHVIVWYLPLCVFVPKFPMFERCHHGLYTTSPRINVSARRLLWRLCMLCCLPLCVLSTLLYQRCRHEREGSGSWLRAISSSEKLALNPSDSDKSGLPNAIWKLDIYL